MQSDRTQSTLLMQDVSTEYIDTVVGTLFEGSYAAAFYAFVQDPTNKWCPPWVKRNYENHNKDLTGQAAFDPEEVVEAKEKKCSDNTDKSKEKKNKTSSVNNLRTYLSFVGSNLYLFSNGKFKFLSNVIKPLFFQK